MCYKSKQQFVRKSGSTRLRKNLELAEDNIRDNFVMKIINGKSISAKSP
jgi:hypothetical protein